MTTLKILTLCGSLRARSSNRALLRACERVAPAGMAFEHYEGMNGLPHFNPDLDVEPVPTSVRELRQAIAAADALLISTPEYAHGLPGAFKNALDWLVSDPCIHGKPVAIAHVARGSTWALDSLREVLRTMSATFLEASSVMVPLGSSSLDENDILARQDLRELLTATMGNLESELRQRNHHADSPTVVTT